LIALNSLSPHDIAETDTGKKFGSPWITVKTAIAEAIERIMENLNHLRMNSDAGQSQITERKLSRANQ
jgi:pyridoxal biosynthesis lyase PdxS